MRFIQVINISVFAICLVGSFPLGVEAQTEAYDEWIKPYRAGLLHSGSMGTSKNDPKTPLAVITVISKPSSTGHFPYPPEALTNGRVIKHNGETESFSRRVLGFRSGCCGQMSEAGILRTKEILAELPPDGERLPPDGRRLLVQRVVGGSVEARVYDLAFLPEKVLDLIRTTRSNFPAFVPSFPPKAVIGEASGFDLNGFVSSYDARSLVSKRRSDLLQIQGDIASNSTSASYKSVPFPQDAYLSFSPGLVHSPDENTLIVSGYGSIVFYDTSDWRVVKQIKAPFVDRKLPDYSRPRFILGGKYLLFETVEFGMRVFETGTWRETAVPKIIPPDAVFYYDSTDGRKAVYQVADQVVFRSEKLSKVLLTLDKETKLKLVSFSPDSSRVAIATAGSFREGEGSRRHSRIRVWNANDGKPLREIRPYEWDLCEEVYGVQWTADGRYLLAATIPNGYVSNRTIGIWDAQTGRNVGELEGCVGSIHGMRLTTREENVIAGCEDKGIFIWDLPAALRQIEEFQKSATRN